MSSKDYQFLMNSRKPLDIFYLLLLFFGKGKKEKVKKKEGKYNKIHEVQRTTLFKKNLLPSSTFPKINGNYSAD